VYNRRRGPLGHVSTTEELLGTKGSSSGLENRKYDRSDPPRRPRYTLYAETLETASLTSGGRSVCIVRSRTKAMKLLYCVLVID
jgi:hypothetical protein